MCLFLSDGCLGFIDAYPKIRSDVCRDSSEVSGFVRWMSGINRGERSYGVLVGVPMSATRTRHACVPLDAGCVSRLLLQATLTNQVPTAPAAELPTELSLSTNGTAPYTNQMMLRITKLSQRKAPENGTKDSG